MNTKDSVEILKAAFDAIPSLIFVVDDDVRIQMYNAAAGLLLGERKTILKRRAGDVLHCLYSIETTGGCGHAPFCKECIVRNSVTEAFQGKRVVRKRTKMEIIQKDAAPIDIYALITTSPFHYKGRTLVLLVIEDISEIAELQRMIPICRICRKVRDDKESWLRVEAYFKARWDVDFSHSLCPECMEKKCPEEDSEIYPKKK